MDVREEQPKVVTKVAAPSSGHPDGSALEVRDAMTAQLLELGKHIAWDGGYDLRGLNINRTNDGWLVTVKAVRRGRPYVAFLLGHSYQDALFMAGEWAFEARFIWKTDKYPTKFVKRELGMF